ncbi:uncharacterized protein FTOL_12852 [Fusarium torulosum]|uniref:Uncharacterized protein n=1 Tax=Fusarium torulosum TaxID=33205 RepID=A0AAE8ML52_9HYPO|nr:uncharacterized protein FTOL_12852 [Fusarium torulosum]
MQQHYSPETTSVKDAELAVCLAPSGVVTLEGPSLTQQLQNRRERGRRAQREFRQRQIDTINELQASKAAMQAAIASIARAATQSDSAKMTAAVQDACRVAGLEISEESGLSCQGCETCSDNNERPGQESSEIAGATTIPWAQEPDTTITQSQSLPILRRAPSTSGLGVEESHYQSGRVSPTLGYGAWLGPQTLISIEYPPMDIIPYLQDGSSLATTVFWTSLSWGFQILGAALGGNVEAVAMTQKIFGAIMPISPGRDVLNGIHARLTYRKTGTIDRDHPGNKPEQAPGMLAAMARSCEDNGTPLETFLTPIDLENLLRSRLGPAYDVIDRSVRGFGSSEEIAHLRGLVQMMTMSSICLGDGPRWSAEKAENAFEYWTRVVSLYKPY